MSEDPKSVLTIGRQELAPDDAATYSRKIAEARSGGKVNSLKGSTPLGHVERPTNIPLLARSSGQGASPISEDGGVQPRPPGSPAIRPETQQQLQEFNEAQKKEAEKVEVELKKDVEEKKEEFFDMFETLGNQNESDRILNNKQRRKEIEAQLIPMKLEDLILRDEVHQDVHIVKDKFWVRFRSMTPQESLFIKAKMADEKVSSDQYLLEKFTIFQLVCGVVSINGQDFPSHLNSEGEPTPDAFMRKYKMIMRKPITVLADLSQNYVWFDLRVRRLLNPGDLKNG